MKRYDETLTGTEPVSGADLAASLRVTNPSDVALCAGYALAARGLVEQWCRITVPLRTVVMFMDSFADRGQPLGDQWWDGVRDGSIDSVFPCGQVIDIPKPPLVSVQSVKAYDDADVSTTAVTSTYYVDATSKKQPGRIVLRRGSVWPTALRSANAVEVAYTAGYANGAVPQELKEAILLVGGYLYANRGDCAGDCIVACGASPLLAAFVVMDPP